MACLSMLFWCSFCWCMFFIFYSSYYHYYSRSCVCVDMRYVYKYCVSVCSVGVCYVGKIELVLYVYFWCVLWCVESA